MQDEVAENVLEKLQVKLTIGEQGRAWRADLGSAENMRRFVLGRVSFQRFDAEGHEIAKRLWGEIIDEDLESPVAAFLRGWLIWQRVLLGISDDPVAELKDAETAADIAIESASSGNPHMLKAQVKLLKGEEENALDWAEKALERSPGLADVLLLAGNINVSTGQHKRGLGLLEQGMRLEPDYPDWVNLQLMASNMLLGRREKAKQVALAVLDADVADVRVRPAALRVLAVLAVWDDRPIEARAYVQQLREILPGFTLEDARRLFHERDREFAGRYVEVLAVAGLPEFAPQ